MLDSLSDRLQVAFRRLGSSGRITEEHLDLALREVRIALIEADVNFQVVRNFIQSVRERALGQDVMKSVTPGQQVIGIVNQALVDVLGGDDEPLLAADRGPTKVMVVGAKGSGKTTLCGRLALRYKQDGGSPLLVATDFERAAASEQLQVLADQIDVPAWIEAQEAEPAEIAGRALREATRIGASAVIIDTRGAVALDDELADSLAALADAVDPTEVLIVVDAMTGQEAVTLAREFDDEIEGTGIVVTKVDSDTRGGAMLSVRHVTGLPIKLISTGENLSALESFHPDRMASRILGMGDVVTLVEKAREANSEQDLQEIARRMRTGQFNLEDFLGQMQQMRQMGPLSGLIDMLPGGQQITQQVGAADLDESFLTHSEAIVLSMTPAERRNPEIINGSRRRRISRGSGTNPADVNRLLNQFREARKLMQAMTSGKGRGGLGRLLGL